MSSFLGFGNKAQATAPSNPQNAQITEQIKATIAQEMATAYASGLVNSLSENCFEKCVFAPSSSLTSIEDKCITDCSAKFMRSWNLVSKAYIARINSQ